MVLSYWSSSVFLFMSILVLCFYLEGSSASQQICIFVLLQASFFPVADTVLVSADQRFQECCDSM